ncbi:hypothetical protein BGZ68_007510 [Mortierella alpina]|nr:hypothetical protein BGZ68_007510 [Mortierella alpina]
MVSFRTLLAFGASLCTVMVAIKAAPADLAAPAEIQSSSSFLDLAKRDSEATLECWKKCHAEALKDVIQADEYQSVMNFCTQGLKPSTPFEVFFTERTCFQDLLNGYKKSHKLKSKFANAKENAAFCIMYECYRE